MPATRENAISAGMPSLRRLPSWNSELVNSDSNSRVLFLALMSCDVFMLYAVVKNSAVPNGMKRLKKRASGPNGPVVLPSGSFLKSNIFVSPFCKNEMPISLRV